MAFPALIAAEPASASMLSSASSFPVQRQQQPRWQLQSEDMTPTQRAPLFSEGGLLRMEKRGEEEEGEEEEERRSYAGPLGSLTLDKEEAADEDG
eukprot:evm.model.NODE_22512_length_6376_cov_22.131901.1